MKNSILLVLLSFALSLPEAHAAEGAGTFFIAPSLLYWSGLRTRTSKEKQDYSVYELKAAYNFTGNIYGGVNYQMESDNSETSGYASASLNNTSKATRTSLGPVLGYVTQTYHVLFTYFYDSKWNLNTTTSGGSNKYQYTGSGLQLDLGYKIEFAGFWFGPQISYKAFTYGKLSTDGSATDSISPKLEDSSLDPSLTIFFFF